MSPLALRRYRADRLLQQEFETMRGRVLAAVRGRLRASGVSLDSGDLEACYAQAWQGLYTSLLDGKEIENPAGWLVLVTFRRAIEDHRARLRAHRAAEMLPSRPRGGDGESGGWLEASHERDLAAELDDRAQLRSLFEGLRGRLSGREREAAVLCYLQGLSRAEAAARMGVSEARMRKVMEGRGAGQPGVAGKVGALIDTIRAGGWCEEQGSLMRGFAFGVLDAEGERYRLAVMHTSECPSCRAYVASLRGLAAALPPAVLPWGVGAGALAGAGSLARAGASAGAGSGVAAGGGGWLLGGGAAGAKLAAGCLLTISIGAGCIAIGQAPAHRAHAPARARVIALAGASPAPAGSSVVLPRGGTAPPTLARAPQPAAALSAPARAAREFGPEAAGSAAASSPAQARAASSGAPRLALAAASAAPPSSAAVAAAAREFGPG